MKDPSSFGHQPSYAGETLCPREYEYLVWALDPPWNRRTDNAASTNNAGPGLDKRKRDAFTITRYRLAVDVTCERETPWQRGHPMT